MNFRKQIKLRRVANAKENFCKSLEKIKRDPMNQKLVDEARTFGTKYRSLAKRLNIDIEGFNDGFDEIKDISVAHFIGLEKIAPPKPVAERVKINELFADEIMVVITGNWGDIPMTLEKWIQSGPGQRYLRSPFRIWNLRTGEELPLSTIPLAYRNDYESLRKIIDGEISDPWNRDLKVLRWAVDGGELEDEEIE